MLNLIFFQMLITKIAVGGCSVIVIKCFDEVDYQLIFYKRKSLQFSGRLFGKKTPNNRNFFHFPVEFYLFITKIHTGFLPKIIFY